jgi:hypothetical protein
LDAAACSRRVWPQPVDEKVILARSQLRLARSPPRQTAGRLPKMKPERRRRRIFLVEEEEAMRHFLMSAVTALALAGPAAAQSDAIRSVIGAQLQAFQTDNFAEAFSYAAPNIKGLFGTPENFGVMVREGYPMVWRPSDVQYLNLEERGGQLVQRVLVADAQGVLYTLEYYMVDTPEGWQIAAVTVLRAPQVGA